MGYDKIYDQMFNDSQPGGAWSPGCVSAVARGYVEICGVLQQIWKKYKLQFKNPNIGLVVTLEHLELWLNVWKVAA